MLSVRELVMDGAASAHIAWNSYITNVPNWKYRANGYAAQQWMDSNGAFQWAVYASGSAGALCGTATGSMTLDQIGKLTTSGRAQHGTSVIAAAASGNASMTCWSASAGYAYGMWCGGNALVFGNTDGAGVPATARMILDGSSNLIVNGAVYVSGPTVSNTAYLMSDSNQTVYNFWTNYALQWRRSDGALVYISPAASGNAAMTLTNNGNLTIPGSLNCAGITSSARITSTADILSYNNVWVGYNNNNSFYLASDGTQSLINLMNGYYLTGVYADGSLRYIWNGSTTARMWLDWTGNVTFSGNCYANAYPGPCDIRLKDDVQPFTAGLATLLKLQPSSWRYNGKGGVADDGRRHIGIHAQELSEVLPECIHVLPEAEDRLQEQLAADPMPLLFTVINALREINDRLQSVEKSGISTQINDIVNRITTLEKISGTKTN
jgi:hypothetical protein